MTLFFREVCETNFWFLGLGNIFFRFRFLYEVILPNSNSGFSIMFFFVCRSVVPTWTISYPYYLILMYIVNNSFKTLNLICEREIYVVNSFNDIFKIQILAWFQCIIQPLIHSSPFTFQLQSILAWFQCIIQLLIYHGLSL